MIKRFGIALTVQLELQIISHANDEHFSVHSLIAEDFKEVLK
jgi:hypothetical protein